MSVSIEEHPSDGHENAASVLGGWLDDYQAGRCERVDMEEAFISVCSSDPEAPWDALSLLDRYQRLGRIEADVARDLKSKISQIGVGATKATASQGQTRGAPATQWRKEPLQGEPEAHHTDDIEDDIEPDATAIRRPMPEPARPAPRSPIHEAREPQEEDEEDEDLDDEAAEPTPLPRHSVLRQPTAFGERATQLRKAAPAREATRPPTPQRPREAPSAQPRIPSPAGRRVLRDRYELLAVLGHGQTSTIYKALDRHRANLAESARYVAVKVLNAAYDSQPEALAELEREFHQAQSLSHPNIASVFDLDRDGSTYFIVMEMLEGDSLASVLRRLNGRPMSQKNALAVIGAIGAALAHAHRRDVVHGDLKPRNVMITWSGEVRVLEFGFARARSQSGDLHDEHGNVSIGTPAYASAERVHGLDPDPSDDVYSLACIAYELLSGRHPYGGRSAFLARAHGRRAQRIASLSHRQWHALQRALAWDRADRKIDIVDFLHALGTSESGHELVPPELLSIPDDLRGRRLRRLAAVAAVLAVVALAVFLVTRIPAPVQNIDVASAVPAPAPTDVAPEPSAPRQTQADAKPSNVPQSGGQPEEEVVQPTSKPAQASSQQPASRSEDRSSAETTEAARPQPARPVATPSSIEFAKDTFVVTESESAVSLEVRRTGSTRDVLNFRWTLRSNSAEAGSDFAAIGPGIERIPAGTRSATILIPLVSDAIVENTELFLVELEPIDEGVTLGEVGHAAVIIVDDD